MALFLPLCGALAMLTGCALDDEALALAGVLVFVVGTSAAFYTTW